MTQEFNAEQWLPVSLEQAWDFFSSPKNLAVITPPEMAFQILHPTDEATYAGMLIDYKVRPLLGIPLSWQTKITGVDKPNSFTDMQLKGPYALWEHTHRFIPQKGGVLMTDHVRYRLPFGILGDLVHTLIVKKKIAGISNSGGESWNSFFQAVRRSEIHAGGRFRRKRDPEYGIIFELHSCQNDTCRTDYAVLCRPER